MTVKGGVATGIRARGNKIHEPEHHSGLTDQQVGVEVARNPQRVVQDGVCDDGPIYNRRHHAHRPAKGGQEQQARGHVPPNARPRYIDQDTKARHHQHR